MTVSFAALVVSAPLVTLAPSVAEAAPAIQQQWSRQLGTRFVESSPTVGNLDGSPNIVVGNHDRNIYALRPDGNPVGGWPRATSHGVDASPAIADTNRDGVNEVFAGSGTPGVRGGGMYSFTNNGQQRWYRNQSDPHDSSLAHFSSPAIADVNDDGTADVSGFTLGLHGWSYNSNSGATNPGWHVFQDDSVFSSPAFADIDRNGTMDYVVGGDSAPGAVVDHRGGLVRALRGDGSVIWQFFTDEIVRSSPSIADLDGDGSVEIVFGTGDYWKRNGGANDSTKIFVLNQDGTLKWTRDLGAYTLASPSLADVNGDGFLDIIEGTWEDPDGGNDNGKVTVFDRFGNTLPGWNRTGNSGDNILGQVVTADIDNDGGQDLIIPTTGSLTVRSGKTGNVISDIRGIGYQNSPWVGNLDGDGLLDIVTAGTVHEGGGAVTHYEVQNPAANLGSLGWAEFRKDARNTGTWGNVPLARDLCAENPGNSYLLSAADGGIFSYCAPFHGSMGGTRINAPIVGLARSPVNSSYWQVASDGGIFAFGGAPFHGSAGSLPLNRPIVGMAPTPTGNGYWLVASDGGIFSYGDARFHGSMGGQPLNAPIVGMASTKSGNGYWLVASDGGVFSFGDARFHGSMGGQRLNAPIVAMTTTPSGTGYWFVAADGGIFSYGDARFHGSMGGQRLNAPIVGMALGGGGYRLVARDGGIFAFDAAFVGSAAGYRLNAPIIGIG